MLLIHQPHQLRKLTCGHRGIWSKHHLSSFDARPFVVQLLWSDPWREGSTAHSHLIPVHSVSEWGLLQAVALIKGVLTVYDLGCKWMFTCGQQAYADYLQVHTWLYARKGQSGPPRMQSRKHALCTLSALSCKLVKSFGRGLEQA